MSIKHMNDVWSIPFKQREKLIALAIADCANDEGIAWPGYVFLMKKTGMARATLAAGIKTLNKFGWCKTENHSDFGKGKKVNVYLIQDDPKVQYVNGRDNLPKVQALNDSQDLPKSSNYDALPKSSVVELPKVQITLPKSSVVEHETPFKPPLGTTIKRKGKFNPLENIPNWIPEEHWIALIENRKFKKLQNTKLALKSFVTSLQEGVDAGFSVTDCIEEYVSCNWQRFDHTWIKKSDKKTDSQLQPRTIRDAHSMQCSQIAKLLNEERHGKQQSDTGCGEEGSLLLEHPVS